MHLPLAGQWGSVCGFSCGQGLIGFGDLSLFGVGFSVGICGVGACVVSLLLLWVRRLTLRVFWFWVLAFLVLVGWVLVLVLFGGFTFWF